MSKFTGPRIAVVKAIERVYDGFFKIDKVKLAVSPAIGGIPKDLPFPVECFERGDAVVALIHDQANGTVVITEQFRYPTYKKLGGQSGISSSAGYIFEMAAGMIKDGEEDTVAAIKRELEEELGYQIDNPTPIYQGVFASPGGSSERFYFYYFCVDKPPTKEGGGLAEEGESIRRVEIPIFEAFRMLEQGEIIDAKTIIALQWLQYQLKIGEINAFAVPTSDRS